MLSGIGIGSAGESSALAAGAGEAKGPGNGYQWHRSRKGKSAEVSFNKSARDKTKAWRDEVKAIADTLERTANGKINWPEAMKRASELRKTRNSNYKTTKEERVSALKGRTASSVNCPPGTHCPGKYTRTAKSYVKRNKRVMTLNSAKDTLRKYYRNALANGKFATETGVLKPQSERARATGAMRKDISSKRKSKPLTACPTRQIVYNRRNPRTGLVQTITRRVAIKTDGCADSWLYRKSPSKRDIKGVDYGEGKNSPAYGQRKLRRQ